MVSTRLLLICEEGEGDTEITNPHALLGFTCFCVNMQPMQKKLKTKQTVETDVSSPRVGEYYTAYLLTKHWSPWILLDRSLEMCFRK